MLQQKPAHQAAKAITAVTMPAVQQQLDIHVLLQYSFYYVAYNCIGHFPSIASWNLGLRSAEDNSALLQLCRAGGLAVLTTESISSPDVSPARIPSGERQ